MDNASRLRYLVGISVFIFTLLFGVYKAFKKESDCFTEPSAKVAFLFDRSEPITALQLSEIRERVKQVLEVAQPNSRVTVYHMTDRGFDPSSEFQQCLPKRNVNPIYEGDQKLARNRFDKFVMDLVSSIKLEEIKIESRSPIVETIDTIMTKSGISRDSGNLQRDQVSLHIFSDLIQNSDLVSLYGCKTNPGIGLLNNSGIRERLQRFSKDSAMIVLHTIKRDQSNQSIPSSLCLRRFWEELLPRAEHRAL